MDDPLPENIEGAKRVSHSVTWTVNVGYVALAVAVLVVAYVGMGALSGPGEPSRPSTSSEEDGPVSALS